MIIKIVLLSTLSFFTTQLTNSSPAPKPAAEKKNPTVSASPAPASASPSPVSAPSPAPVVEKPSTSNSLAPATNAKDDNKTSTTTAAPVPAAKGSVVLPPEKVNPVTIPKFAAPPVIDGKLSEEVWATAAVLKDFYQIDPGDNIAPSKPTEVLLGYDAKFLYIAFRAFDEQDKIRSTVAKRDNIFNDDYVGFYLDTFNDKRKAFEMFFNPLGIQGDGVMTEGQGEDFSVDILMESKGTIDETGYFVEIAIPFKSLRYEAGKGKFWGAHFFRRIQRFNRELDSWMPFSRSISSNLSQAGRLGGLEGIAVERTLELIPSVTLSESGRFVRTFGAPFTGADPGRILNEPMKFEAGLTAKFIPNPGTSIDLAINPDFAQVEADQLVVTANQRFPIFFPEKRPFFLEGIDIFRTPVTVVHTRAIVDPDIALKTTGKMGRNTFGIMAASDNGPGNLSIDDREFLRRSINSLNAGQLNRRDDLLKILDKNAMIGVLRLKRDVGKENSLGILATTYNFPDKYNQLFSADGRFVLSKTANFTFQAIGTVSKTFFFDSSTGRTEDRKGNGFGYSAYYGNFGRNWGHEFGSEGFTNDYRADVGFVQRTNSNFSWGMLRYNSDPKPKAKLISYHIHNFSHIDYDWQGRLYAWESESLVELTLPRSSWWGIWWEPAYERLFDYEFGAVRTAFPCNPFGRTPANGTNAAVPACTFYGPDNERSSNKQHLSTYFGSNFSKQIQFNGQITHRWGHMDLDFGNLPKYPRASPPAVLARELAADGLCSGPLPDARCVAPQDPGRGNLLQINGGITYQPTNEFRTSLSLNKQRLTRYDTGLTAFDVNIWTWRGTYQFTKATFARVILDYNTLNSRIRAQFLTGWTPSPGTSFYIGYNDDITYDGLHPFNQDIVPGFRRNSRTFFIKASYLIRKSFGS
jgi:hypothetical protein